MMIETTAHNIGPSVLHATYINQSHGRYVPIVRLLPMNIYQSMSMAQLILNKLDLIQFDLILTLSPQVASVAAALSHRHNKSWHWMQYSDLSSNDGSFYSWTYVMSNGLSRRYCATPETILAVRDTNVLFLTPVTRTGLTVYSAKQMCENNGCCNFTALSFATILDESPVIKEEFYHSLSEFEVYPVHPSLLIHRLP